MNDKSLKIGKKAFITSFIVILMLMITAFILTKFLPAGRFERTMQNGREIILPETYKEIDSPDISILRLLSAPFEVLLSPESGVVIVIIAFLLLMAGSFSLLLKSGVVAYIISKLINKYYNRRYTMLSAISLVFMLFGATFGIFEEIIILVPFCIFLAREFKWDSLTGLGMSLLSVGVGFGTAIFNPFTLGVAQKLAGLPLYSATIYRIPIFLSFYMVLQIFLKNYVKNIEKNPKNSLVYDYEIEMSSDDGLYYDEKSSKTAKIFSLFLMFILLMLVSSFFINSLSNIIFPAIGLMFGIASFLSVILSKSMKAKEALRSFGGALPGVLPAIMLILMAMSIKLIMERAYVLDTILYRMQLFLNNLGELQAVFAVFALILVMNFFIGSGSAKAFLILPLLIPLTDLLEVNRQIIIQAFVFGDGTSNLLYPTNAALMIALGFSIVSYPKWLKWTYKLQCIMIILSIAWLWIAYLINLGPF